MEYNIRKNLILILFLLILTIIVSVISLSVGSVSISFTDVLSSLFSQNSDNTISIILNKIRLPRVLLSLVVGGGLSVSGAVFQSVLINPLAEPYILGISGGSAFGAMLAILLGFSLFTLQIFAFVGALIVVFLVLFLAKRFGTIDPNSLLLTGVMIGAFFSALILLIITLLDDSLRTAIFWLMGNLSYAKMEDVIYISGIVVIVTLILTVNAQKLNVLSIGEEQASLLGVNVRSFTVFIYSITSLMVGAVVSVSGIIGFVGLLIPHVCRLLFGLDNKTLIPASFFVGAIYLAIADLIARNLVSPSEIPVGAITAVIGAPIFIYLLRKRFKTI